MSCGMPPIFGQATSSAPPSRTIRRRSYFPCASFSKTKRRPLIILFQIGASGRRFRHRSPIGAATYWWQRRQAYRRLWAQNAPEALLRAALDAGEQVLRVMRQLDEIGGRVLAGVARPFDQLAGDAGQPRRGRNEAGLLLDRFGRQIVFRARHAPAAPFRVARHDDWIGAGNGMAGAVFRGLPLVPCTDNPPGLRAIAIAVAVGVS